MRMLGSHLLRLSLRLPHRARDERGGVLVLTAIFMTVFIGLAGLAIDVGAWYQTERKAQSAADAAALAGMQDLPGAPVTAASDAQSYLTKNLFSGATAVVTTPYNSDANQIHVTVSATAPVWFTKLFGFTPVAVSASATAKKAALGTPSSVFAFDTACGTGLSLDGNNNTITGSVRSNGSFSQSGNNDTYAATTYGGPNTCAGTTSGNSTFAGQPLPVRDSSQSPWPIYYSVPACTYSGTTFTFSTNGETIPPGVYCATTSISTTKNDITGNVTFYAPSITLGGNNLSLSPFVNNLVAYQTGTGDLNVTGNNLNGGTIFAPNATINLTGNNGTAGSGFIEGLHVALSGNNWTFTGTGPAGAGLYSGALTQ